MSEEKKFILCPSCGAILEKGVTFCGYCGSNTDDKPKSGFDKEIYEKREAPSHTPQTPPQQPFKQQPQQENYSGNRGFGLFGGSKQQTYSAADPMSGMSEEEWAKHIDTERKIMRATIFGWITFCSSVLSPIFLIITLVYVFQARKAIGRMDPRLTRALIY
ncbi:MAG: zinc ribbon domain-containing protein, partial [Candidatus Heimdallarchaeota archaeon]